jgi:ketosteroid isomerase-like protein
MNLLDIVRRYFDLWNSHDPAQVVSLFAPDGTYRDPAVPEGLKGEAIGEYVRQLIAMMPDLSFEIISLVATGEHGAVAEWLMHGNVSAGEIALPGADFFELVGDHIQAIHGYFDQSTLSEQLGKDNWCHWVTSGKLTRPGAFSLTWIEGDPQDMEQMGNYGMRTGMEMMEKPGALTKLTAGVGQRWFTITAWENLDDVAEMRRTNQAHERSNAHLFHDGFWSGCSYQRMGSVSNWAYLGTLPGMP